MSLSYLNKPKVRREFFKALDSGEYGPLVNALAIQTMGVIGASAYYTFGDSAPAAAKWKGTRETKRIGGKQVQVLNEPWTSQIGLPKDDMRRDETGTIQRRISELADRLRQLQFKLIITLINNGTSNTIAPAYDGVALLSASHSYGKSGTQTNILAAAQVGSLDIASASAPTPEEFATGLLDSIGYMCGYLDDEGEPLNETAKSFLALVPMNMWGVAQAAIRANNLASGKTNVVNVLNAGGFNIAVQPTPRLTNGATFYLHRTDGIGAKAFIMQEEVPADVEVLDENSDHFKKEREYLALGEWIGGAGVGEPLHTAKCTFS